MIQNVRDGQPLTANIDPAEVGKAAAVGAVAGAVGGATFGLGTAALGTGLAGTMASGAISGAAARQAGVITDNALSGRDLAENVGNVEETVKAAAWGAGTAGLGYTVGRGITALSERYSVETPYGTARQSISPRALWTRYQVGRGQSIFRAGQFGRSSAIEGQFWAPENPMTPGYEAKYGVAFDQVEWILEGTVRPGGKFITRPAPPFGKNPGGAIEVVVKPFDIYIRGFYMR